jgi:hypothetical protein
MARPLSGEDWLGTDETPGSRPDKLSLWLLRRNKVTIPPTLQLGWEWDETGRPPFSADSARGGDGSFRRRSGCSRYSKAPRAGSSSP